MQIHHERTDGVAWWERHDLCGSGVEKVDDTLALTGGESCYSGRVAYNSTSFDSEGSSTQEGVETWWGQA